MTVSPLPLSVGRVVRAQAELGQHSRDFRMKSRAGSAFDKIRKGQAQKLLQRVDIHVRSPRSRQIDHSAVEPKFR